MARPETTDYLQNFRFHVSVAASSADAPDYSPLKYKQDIGPGIGGEAGFQSVSIPDVTIESTEYREGTFKYTKKFPGPPTIGDVSMMRGVVKNDTKFFEWAISTISGGAYRVDIDILQFSRSPLPAAGTISANEYSDVAVQTPARIYHCYQCLPTRAKPAGDLDATSGEVAMAECDFALEYFTVEVSA
jgi:phage tail-like protein